MEIWTGFLIGFLGSFHCVGMCGPIVLALPSGSDSKSHYVISRVFYNFGRVITYSIFGLVGGIIGKQIVFTGYQNVLSIAVGITILVVLLRPVRLLRKISFFPKTDFISSRLKKLWGPLLKSGSNSSLLAIGILNGFLPCGFVYLALAGAVSTGGIVPGIVYMVMFGLGTAPILIALSLTGRIVSLNLRRKINRLLPVGAVILAAIFILRGLSLGIPYLSPNIKAHAGGMGARHHNIETTD
jgi:sulfite exporter TauE/SafE